IAIRTSQLSRCERAKVGAVLVNWDYTNMLSYGYNGTPSGFDNCGEVDNVTKSEVLHAETNAIMKVATSVMSSQGGILYLTLSPCFDCAKLIIQCKIKRVVYLNEYRITEGIVFLRKAGIIVQKFSDIDYKEVEGINTIML